MPKKWTVTFRNVAGSALHVGIDDADSEDEALKLARLEALRHFSADEIKAAETVEVRPGHAGLDIGDLQARFGSPKD
jgi:hypothetical protein